MTDVKKIEKMSDQELRGELHEARAVIEHLQSRVDELESALRGYVKATTGQESATVTFPMALEGEGK